MNVVNLTGATIFKFHRLNKTWREKGFGDVTFLLKGDKLMVGLGNQSFFVKGGLRPKGPNAIVMRVWGVETSGEEPDMILAVRFGKESDSKRLFALIADKMLDQQLVGMPCTLRRPMWPPLPPWIASLRRTQRNAIQSLIKNANPKHLVDGTIHMQLSKMYGLSPEQIEETINFYKSRLPRSKSRESHRRAVSWSINSASTFPSISNHNPGWRPGRKQYRTKTGLPSSQINNSLKPRIVYARHMRLPHSSSTLKREHGSRGNFSELSAQLLLSPEMNLPLKHPQDIGPNPNKQPSKKTETKNPNPSKKTTGVGKIENQQATPEKDVSQEKLAQLVPVIENLSSSKGIQRFTTRQEKPPNEQVQEDSNLPLCPLTEQNLLLYNRLKPPLKGDYRTIVRSWLQKSVP